MSVRAPLPPFWRAAEQGLRSSSTSRGICIVWASRKPRTRRIKIRRAAITPPGRILMAAFLGASSWGFPGVLSGTFLELSWGLPSPHHANVPTCRAEFVVRTANTPYGKHNVEHHRCVHCRSPWQSFSELMHHLSIWPSVLISGQRFAKASMRVRGDFRSDVGSSPSFHPAPSAVPARTSNVIFVEMKACSIFVVSAALFIAKVHAESFTWLRSSTTSTAPPWT